MTESEVLTEEETKPWPDILRNVNDFREWIESHAYFPKDLSVPMLKTFQRWCETEDNLRNLFSNYFIYRQIYGKIFRNRCYGSTINKKFSSIRACATTSDATGNKIVVCCWLSDGDVSRFSFYQFAKYIFNEVDITLQEVGGIHKTLFVVFDMDLFTRDHLDSITKYCAHVVSQVFNALPISAGGILLINAPDFVSDFTSLFTFDFHIIDSVEDLRAFIPPAYLPCDLGGLSDGPTKEDFYQAYIKRMGLYNSILGYSEIQRDQELAIRYAPNDEEDAPAKEKKDKKGKKKKKKAKGKGKSKK